MDDVDQRLLQTLQRSVATVPAYRPFAALLRDVTAADARQVLRAFPLLERQQLADNLAAYLSDAFARDELKPAFTGGSTGDPLRFLRHPSEHAYEQHFRARAWRSFGLTPTDRTVVVNLRRDARARDRDEFLTPNGTLFLPMMVLTDEAILPVFERIRQHRPAIVRGTANLVFQLALFCARQNLRIEGLKGVAYSASVLLPSERRFIVEQLGVPLVSLYGQTERAAMAVAEGHDQPFEVFNDYGIIELIAENGTPIEQPGRVGEIVATPLFPRATGLLRYRTGDLAAWHEVGRSLTDIEGRRAYVLIDRAGQRNPVGIDATDRIVAALPAGAQLQFVQFQAGRLTIRISQPQSASSARLVAAAELLRNDFELDWEWGTAPEISPNGKRQMWLSKLPPLV